MPRLLLVQPTQNDGLIYFGQTIEVPGFGSRALVAPLGVATVAAATPDNYEVDIWDEIVSGPLVENQLLGYDLIGVTGYEAHVDRACVLGHMIKRQGILAVAGGPGPSASPEKWRPAFDVVFIGEAEHTWPQFIADWEAGHHRTEYRQITKPDLADSPLPRWSPLDLRGYMVGAVQTTRGCPFDCSYCDVIYLYGRRPRHKPIDKVLAEVSDLEGRGVGAILFSDDNLYGNPKYAKAMLRELIPVNNSFVKPIKFSTQITMNMAKDDELLALMADANFARLFIGVETPNVESLKEVNKTQNCRDDMFESLQKIQSYGMAIRAGMMLGFDHDTTEIFDQQLAYVAKTHIPLANVGILQAPIGTPIWRKYYQENRIVESSSFSGSGQRTFTNIIPGSMTRAELYNGLSYVLGRLYEWPDFSERLLGFVDGVTRKPKVKRRPSLTWREIKIYAGFVRFFSRLSAEDRRYVRRIVAYTLRTKAFLLEMVVSHIFQFIHEKKFVPKQQAKLRDQIEWEKGNDLKIAKGSLLVPEAFKKSYRLIFPELLDRLTKGLYDSTRITDSLVEVFTDFVVRWGDDFTDFEDHHRVFLLEICDRTIAKENGEVTSQQSDHPSLVQDGPFRILPSGVKVAALPNLKAAELPNEILRIVEQDLRGEREEAASAIW